MSERTDWNVEAMLANAAWMRALARGLVGEADADDVVQETWIAALGSESATHRGWLRTVLVNFAKRARRGERHRAAREEIAARPEALPSTLAIVERASLHHAVVEEVLRLGEPYRSTVLLRYFDGLTCEAIASRTGVPAATVRGRLKRALDELRRRLDRRPGGREAWSVALLGIAGLSRPKPAAAAAGVAIVWKLTACVAVAIVLVVAALFAWRDHSSRTSRPALVASTITNVLASDSPPSRAAAPSTTAAGATANEPAKPSRAANSAATTADEPPQPDGFESGETFLLTVKGHALDEHGKPVEGATVWLDSTNGKEARLGETTTNADGEFGFRDALLPVRPAGESDRKSGTFQIFGVAPGRGFAWHGMRFLHVAPAPKDHATGDTMWGFYQDEEIVTDLRFGPAATISGRVLDDAGQPVEHVAIELLGCDLFDHATKDDTNFREFWSITHLDESLRKIETGKDGRFRLDGLAAEACYFVNVTHPDFAPLSLHAGTTTRAIAEHNDTSDPKWAHRVWTGELEIRLQATPTVHVSVIYGDTGAPAAAIGVYANEAGSRDGSSAGGTSDDDGKLDLRLPPGDYTLTGDPPRGSAIDYVRTQQRLTVEGAPAVQSCEFRMQRGCVLILQAIDKDTGAGLEGASFYYEPEDRPGQSWELGSDNGFVNRPKTDAAGQLRVVVKPGRRRLMCGSVLVGYSRVMDGAQVVDLPAGETVNVRFDYVKSQPSKPQRPYRFTTAPPDPDRVTLAGKVEDADRRARLGPGRTPGTFRLELTGRAFWNGPPAWPIDVGVHLVDDREFLANQHLESDEPFTIAIDAKPGEYAVESQLAESAKKLYRPGWGGRIWIEDDGTANLATCKLTHARFMEMLEPKERSEIREARPLVRWTPIEGAARYAVMVIEGDRFTRQELVRSRPIFVESPEFRMPADLVVGHYYDVRFTALDAQNRTLGNSGGEFFAGR
jgi:RNA polymerase sigma factor (sigma-70 family)